MQEIMKNLAKISRNRPIEILVKKKEGAKIVEYFGNFVPEEILRAAGAETFFLNHGGDPEPPEAVLDEMLRFVNPMARSLLGYHLLNLDSVTPNADLIVVEQTYNHVGRVSELMEKKNLPVLKVGVPIDPHHDFSIDYYKEELKDMRGEVEKLVGHPVDDDKVRENYSKTNRINALLKQISELRKQENPPLGFYDFLRLNHYSFAADYDTSIQALEQVYDKLKDAPGKFKEKSPRLLVIGRAFAVGDYTVPKLVEDCGGMIVADFMDEAMRPYMDPAISLEGDVIDAFAEARYAKRLPISIFQPGWKARFEHVKRLIEEYKVDGVIWYQLSFDEIYDMEYTCVSKWLNEMGIPLMRLESSYEYSREAMEPLTTRVESFIESIKEVM